jgi:hypothetical protein
LLQLADRQGQLTTAQMASVGDLSIEQEALALDAESLSRGSQMPAAFTAQLGWAADEMTAAAALLRDSLLSPDVTSAQQNALERLRMIVDALQPPEPEPGEQNNDSPMGEQPPMPPPPDGPTPDIHDLAEVKLLRLMQAEINRRTANVESQRNSAGNLTEMAQAELDSLSAEQGKVAELALKLVQSLGQPKRSDRPPDDSLPLDDDQLLRDLDDALLK